MAAFFQRINHMVRPSTPVPAELRALFKHLYLEIGWFGILSGTTIAFLAIYATRSGASPEQIGLMSAVPGLVNLIFSLPAGRWLSKRRIGGAVFWASVAHRAFYLVLIPLPVLLLPKAQVWVILAVTFLMNIPATALMVGFNSMFGDMVPVEWRGHVAGLRNAIISIVATVSTLIAGEILHTIAFPYGYQVVFTLGLLGAGMSSYHLYRLSSIATEKKPNPDDCPPRPVTNDRALAIEIRALYTRSMETMRLDVMKGKFARIMLLLFCWHLAQFMTIPIVTLFIVNQLKLTDQVISLAGALFNITFFLGSLRLNRATLRFGNKLLVSSGIIGLSLFPIMTALGVQGYVIANIICGLAWALAGGALYNYILDNVPAYDRPAYMAWYSVVSNGAILIGSLSGPAIASVIGFSTALILFGIGRLLAGVAILKWG